MTSAIYLINEIRAKAFLFSPITLEGENMAKAKSYKEVSVRVGGDRGFAIILMEEVVEFHCQLCEIWRWYCMARAGDPQGESPPPSFWSCDCSETNVVLK